MHRSPDESGNVNTDANQMTSQISSTVTEVFSEQDMNLLGKEILDYEMDSGLVSYHRKSSDFFHIDHSGPDSLTTTKSVTKCIQIVSPGNSSTVYFLLFNLQKAPQKT